MDEIIRRARRHGMIGSQSLGQLAGSYQDLSVSDDTGEDQLPDLTVQQVEQMWGTNSTN
jgi:hypothetical protein